MANQHTPKRFSKVVWLLLLCSVGLTLYVALQPRPTSVVTLPDLAAVVQVPFTENPAPKFFMQFVEPPSDIQYSMWFVEPELSEYPMVVPSR